MPSAGVQPIVPVTHRRQCSAHKTNGEPCHRAPIRGGAVCIMHGGKAPQVVAKAEERIRDMVDPALNRLRDLIDDDLSGVALAAVKDVLDRAGYKPPDRQQISGPDGGPIQTEDVGMSEDERTTRIKFILERIAARGGAAGGGNEV